jgi:hypothetical protein
MHPVCIIEVNVTVNNVTVLSVAQKMILWLIYVAENNKTYLGRYVN